MPGESWRFRRAVYRIWLYTSIFPGDCYEIDEFDDDNIDLIQRQRTAILHEYPTDNLFQLYGIARFFRGILEGVPVGDEEQNNSHILSSEENLGLLLSLGLPGIADAQGILNRSYQFLEDTLAVQRLLLSHAGKHLDGARGGAARKRRACDAVDFGYD
ncbi:hypothetical protein B0H13DRAFT_1882660 [Mycena leptocephala]|nr:hypothetical protein B0H13DRAFT_1882660 [Mycena leptocephala]